MGVEWLKGRTCTRVFEHYPQNFTFEFGEGSLAVDGLWRILAGGRVILTSRDHKQRFGLPEPVDAYRSALSQLQGRRVVEVRLIESSADLVIEFEGDQRLELLTDENGRASRMIATCGRPWESFGFSLAAGSEARSARSN